MRVSHLRRRLRLFGRADHGSVTFELIASVMIINVCLMAFYFWWGVYNAHALVDRMTYTMNDLITRQRGVALQRSFLDGLETTAEFILDPDQNAAIRFTQVTMTAGAAPTDPPTITVDWSYSPCGALPPAEAGAAGFDTAALPLMAVGTSMVVTDVETPFAGSGDLLPALQFETRAVSLYRFVMRMGLEGDGTATCID